MKSWYAIKNKSSDVLDISIHDEIGMWGISASDFINELRGNGNDKAKSINLSIHSPGGSVLDGFAMYNALKNHQAKVFGTVEGIAASAASYVLMASDVIEMPEDSFLMIHNAWGFAMGDSDEMRQTAALIDKLQDSIVNIYVQRSNKSEEEVRDMMKAETWMNAEDALNHGFIDTITNPIDVAAKIGAFNKYFKSMPVKNSNEIDGIETITDFEKYLRDLGASRSVATALATKAKVIFQSDSDDTEKDITAGLSEVLSRFKVPESLNALPAE